MGKGFKGLFTGGLFGFALGLLFAPQKGDETRKKVKEVLDTAKGKAEEFKGRMEKKN
ncbi:MAG: YtxH domain-containing protein [Candidatus Saganbacteria bacterium]|nr:YtxH domain-containing protein [Candidatus Saganbacteria bacterium]